MNPGPVILAGGAEFDERMADADRVWLAARGMFRPRLGVFPTANTERPDRAAANGVSHFRRLVTHSEAVLVTSRDTASDERILEQVSKLDYAYFAGGEPLYLAETLAGSQVWAALLAAWRQGMGLGGSSAGAMAMCQAIYVREQWGAALALVPGVVCLPHFNRRDAGAVEQARRALTARGLVGLGIDESTALVWKAGEGWRAAGRGRVTLLTAEDLSFYQNGPIEHLPEPEAPDMAI
jgi:cyanophycinase